MKAVPGSIQAKVNTLKTVTEAQKWLSGVDARLTDIDDELEELMREQSNLGAERLAITERIEALSAEAEAELQRRRATEAEMDPETAARNELVAAVYHPNQARFPFLKDGADGEDLDR